MSGKVDIVIYVDEVEKSYVFDISDKIIDMKNRVLKENPKDGFNYIDLEYVSPNINKNYGKLYFDRGNVLRTMDEYRLASFTDGGNTYHFKVHYDTISQEEMNTQRPKKLNLGFLNRNDGRQEKRVKKEEGFVFNIDEFPPL